MVKQGKDVDTITLPYEFLPQPKVDNTGYGCDHTVLVTLAVPAAGEGNRVRFYKEKGK